MKSQKQHLYQVVGVAQVQVFAEIWATDEEDLASKTENWYGSNTHWAFEDVREVELESVEANDHDYGW